MKLLKVLMKKRVAVVSCVLPVMMLLMTVSVMEAQTQNRIDAHGNAVKARVDSASIIPEQWPLICPDDQNTGEPATQWWTLFEDTLLDSLVCAGLSNNYDIVSAVRRIEVARAQLGATRAGYFPTISLSASYSKGQSSGMTTTPTGKPAGYGYFSGGLSLQWEIDIFGKVTAQVKEKKALVRVSKAERDGVELSMAAEICLAYIQLRVDQAQLQVAHAHAARQKKALSIATARHDTGLASMMDVDQASQVYYSTIASIPPLENSIRTEINALCVLLGEPLGSLNAVLEPARNIPSYRQMISTGIPYEVLRRRPDLVEAEANVDEAAAALGIAHKDWLPSLSVQASVGTEAHSGKDLFKKNSLTYSVVPTLSWTVFDGLARNYNTVAARQQMESAIDAYNLAMLTAVQEVDNAMNTYFTDLKYIDALQKVVEASEGYDTRAMENYKTGLSPFINVANAQVTLLENVNTLLSVQGQALSSLVNLYKALGGDFKNR